MNGYTSKSSIKNRKLWLLNDSSLLCFAEILECNDEPNSGESMEEKLVLIRCGYAQLSNSRHKV